MQILWINIIMDGPPAQRWDINVVKNIHGGGGFERGVVICSLARHLTLTLPFSTQECKWYWFNRATWQNAWVICDGLASHPTEVANNRFPRNEMNCNCYLNYKMLPSSSSTLYPSPHHTPPHLSLPTPAPWHPTPVGWPLYWQVHVLFFVVLAWNLWTVTSWISPRETSRTQWSPGPLYWTCCWPLVL